MKCLALLQWVLCALAITISRAALIPGNVLVVYNDPGNIGTSDSFLVWEYYAMKRPGVLGLNLDVSLSPGSVNYADFQTKIRDKIWDHLENNSLEATVRVIVLTTGIPHQINDFTNIPNPGATEVTNLFNADNATLASVDSELTLIRFDLGNGEMNGAMDSHADNFVTNPYYDSATSIPYSSAHINFFQVEIMDSEDESAYHFWEMRQGPFAANPGVLYLTARLDGHSVDDVKNLIDRGADVRLDTKRFSVILDETAESDEEDFDRSDFADTHELLSPSWNNIVHDETARFLVGQTLISPSPGTNLSTVLDPVAFLAGYGANHLADDQTNWVFTYQGQLPHGAVFNTYESFNGMEFGGSTPSSLEHGQVADWVAIGGTFGIGHVWEPFSLAVGQNVILTGNFYNNGLTWVESAWSSIEVISWQNTVVGDPLATVTLLDDLPQLALSITSGPGYSREVLEDDVSVHTISITSDIPVIDDLPINLSFLGATVGDDFTTTIAGYTSGTTATVTIPGGQTQTSFTLTIVDDSDDEGLEILTAALAESSLDTNGDGYGESYGFLAMNASADIPIADSAFVWWNFEQFGALEPADQDGDGDGLVNLWEYFLQTDPNIAAHTINVIDPLIPLNAVVDGNTLTFEVPNTFPTDIRLAVETNSTLNAASWSELVSRKGNSSWVVVPSGTELLTETAPGMPDKITLTTSDPVRGFRRFRLSEVLRSNTTSPPD